MFVEGSWHWRQSTEGHAHLYPNHNSNPKHNPNPSPNPPSVDSILYLPCRNAGS